MKVRYAINADGFFVDRDGNTLGRLTSFTLDVSGGGLKGGASVELSKDKKNPPKPPADDGVQRVWDEYVELFDAGRQTLNAHRRRDITNALKLRPIATVLKALHGLRISPHHNGENERRTQYLDIRYALRGNSRLGESPEERIDKMAALAPENGAVGWQDSGLSDERIRTLVDEVEQAIELPGNESIKRRGIEAKARLEQAGFKLTRHGTKVRLGR